VEAPVIADRYVKIVLTVIAVALVAIAVHPWLAATSMLDSVAPTPAQAQAVAKYEVMIPKEWGKYIAFSNGNLLMEAADKSLRIVDVEGKPPEYPKVKALIRWQP
jgi:hypothetical protein